MGSKYSNEREMARIVSVGVAADLRLEPTSRASAVLPASVLQGAFLSDSAVFPAGADSERNSGERKGATKRHDYAAARE